MDSPMRTAGRELTGVAAVAGGVWLAVAAGPVHGTAVAGALCILLAIPDSDLAEVALWIAAGCGVAGVAGWAIATLFLVEVPPTAGLGAGIAVGGGLGAAVRLLVFEKGDSQAETMTVEMADGDAPEPEPADLFEASPDPLLYYHGTGDGALVRAVNPAFEERFGVTEAGVDGVALADAVRVSDPDSVTAAATGGEQFDAVLRCETGEGIQEMRVRVVPVGKKWGYVVYTELAAGS